MATTVEPTVTKREAYESAREKRVAVRMVIVRALSAAGEDPFAVMSSLEETESEWLQAWSAMSHEERMAVLADDQQRHEAMIARTAHLVTGVR